MRTFSLLAASALALAAANAGAAPVSSGPAASASPIILAQEKKSEKSETLGEKIKRTWHRLTWPSYSFCAHCLLPPAVTLCTAQGKDKDAALSTCASRYPLCLLTDDLRDCGKGK
jgi:hypothetical protein